MSNLTHSGTEEECEKEEVAERSSYVQTGTPYSLSSCGSWGRGRVEDLEGKSEVVPWKKGEVDRGGFSFCLSFSHPLCLYGYKSN